MSLSLRVDVPALNQYRARAQMRARRHPILVAFSSLSILTERRLCNIAHVNERERPLWVICVDFCRSRQSLLYAR
jgi:hypothetical protein